MNSNQDSLRQLVMQRKARRESQKKFLERLKSTGLPYSFLSDQSQDTILGHLRFAGGQLHDCFKTQIFNNIPSALLSLGHAAEEHFSDLSIFMPYEPYEGAGVIMPTAATIDYLSEHPFLISDDGFIITTQDGMAGAIIDYSDRHELNPTHLTLLGRAAQ